ncbi:phosphoribosylformylglycinamidine synthase I [Candidatus Fermentibacteria bacterium]|nr:phosphoribosylformylglycinamidine synthase I [Candidatus Fermentibacteria bacterium]
MRPGVAVVQFPGSNCEYETALALQEAGLDGRIVRWNASPSSLASFQAFVLPGGFSYQDRIRAGAVAARDGVMDAVCSMASAGRPVLGICNGAQILVESGLVPGWRPGTIEAALASNLSPGRTGYYADWVFVRPARGSARSPWLCACDDSPIPLPVAHAEGRFLFPSGTELDDLESSGTPALTYCMPGGEPAVEWPWNPNGSSFSLAGILDPSGGVLAMMPHPERARWLWQVPPGLPGPWGAKRRLSSGRAAIHEPGPGSAVFSSLARWLGAG